MLTKKSYNSVWQIWSENSFKFNKKSAITFWSIGSGNKTHTFGSILKRANFYSNHFFEIGIKKGEVCAIVLRHHPEFYPIYMGIAGIGALPAVLAYPNPRLHPDKFRQGITGMSQRSGLDWIITDDELEPVIRPLVTSDKSTIKDILFPLRFSQNEIPDNQAVIENIRNNILATDPFLLQHSSGTTGLQKPVQLSNEAVLTHIKNYAESIALSESDKVISWLPLYHDMGLIAAFHLPLASGITSVQLDPFEWVLAPHILIEATSKERGTLIWLPNFAYNVLADKVRNEWIEEYRLDTLRMVINCSEPIRHYSHHKFFEKFDQFGFSPTALSTCYAMAETTFAVSQNPPGEKVRELILDRNELSKGRVKIISNGDGRICVSSGKLINECTVKIVDERRTEIGDNQIGEIAINSVSMFDGYRNYPEKTSEVLVNEWFYSGDYGFIHEDQLYVIGRKKDIIIVAGKNLYPEDIEDLVGRVEGVIPGRVIAFGEENEAMGTEQISVIAESNYENESEKKELIKRIKSTAMEIDITIPNIYIVPPRWLIKSSAGKPSRSANKQRIIELK